MAPDPFYETMRRFIPNEATLDEVRKADAESLEAHRLRRDVRQMIETGLSKPETAPQVLDLLSSKLKTVPHE
jgi:hypothetical protein